MRKVHFSNVNPKQVIQFTYSRGSTPGSTRTLAVKEASVTSIAGYDFDRGEYRRFSTVAMSAIQLLKPEDGAFIIDTNYLPSTTNLTRLMCDYENDNNYTHLDSTDLWVVKRDLLKPKVKTVVFDSVGQLLIKDEGGHCVLCVCRHPSKAEQVNINFVGKTAIRGATPQEVSDAIREAVNG